MDNRCVIVCDSGAGGLRLLKMAMEIFPQENFLYFIKIFLDFLRFLDYNVQADKLIKAYLSKRGDVA